MKDVALAPQAVPISVNKQDVYPSKIVCVGRNYAKHIAELGNETPSEPVIFIKPSSAISHALYTHPVDDIHFETELVFLIANQSIQGVGIGLDLTKRDIQNRLKEKGLPWERAKAFDASVVFTDFVDMPSDDAKLELRLFIDGTLQQAGSTDDMLYKPNALLKSITEFMTLFDGDLLMTGTPSGVGLVKNGQTFCVQLIVDDGVLLERSWQAELPLGL
jgi:2-keto-4-pentenoate hydratase/2-oxohepta-3-ene-1,7-dioic acid hydratase in catechol pathway